TLVREGEDWLDLSASRPELSGGDGTATRVDHPSRSAFELGTGSTYRMDKHLPEIASLLDPEQYEVITSPDQGLIVVKGSAGSGKTTVALHRVAYLAFLDPSRFKPRATLVVVFSRALAAYIGQVLPGLGVEGVKVRTFASWANEQRRHHVKGMPDAYSDGTPAVVTRLKLHSALEAMLQEACGRRPDSNPRQLFEELFSDREWLGRGFERYAKGAFSDAELDEVHRWCTRQSFNRMDGGGDAEGEEPSLDTEDDAILIRLYQRLKGALKSPDGRSELRYRHLVVDEAQDLSPLELAVLLDTVRDGDPITLAGDTAQQIVEASDFQDWEHTLDILGVPHAKVSPLKISYRSTAQIMALAQEVLGPLAPEEPPESGRDGAPVELFTFREQGEAMTFLSDALWGLTEREPSASVAVLCRLATQAEVVHSALCRAELPALHLVRDYDFTFRPGVEVAEISQAKGLEFDYVIVWDCDSKTYPITNASRHLLHVAITRSAHQCWLIAVGDSSPLLPAELVSQRIE
ncbi:MAG: AAA family ATPase, partial [Myxococcales bacterium]|nr:AAA family ATPase [Myxococcales bacterium]